MWIRLQTFKISIKKVIMVKTVIAFNFYSFILRMINSNQVGVQTGISVINIYKPK